MVGRTIKSTRILLADDHKLVRSGIRKMIEKEPGFEVVAEVGSGEEVLGLVRSSDFQVDVVLMDIKMPGIGGLETTRKLQHVDDEIKVLVITACDGDIFASHSLQAGALGYITKEATVEEMIRAIRKVQLGQRYISPDIASELAMKGLSGPAGKSSFDSLSTREMQVCLMVIHGTSVQNIANNLALSPKTVNSYRYRIFEKLTVSNDVLLTLLAIQHGVLKDIEAS